MKAYTRQEEPPPPPPKVVVLEMSEEEAEVLCALVGGVSAQSRETSIAYALFDELAECLPDRSCSFSDYFEARMNCVVEKCR